MAKPRVPSADAAAGRDAGFPVAVRVRPGAGRTRVGGRYDGPHGPALIIAVGAPAVDGKATEAARRALAEALGVRPGDVTLRLGATSRDKVFAVAVASPPQPTTAGPERIGAGRRTPDPATLSRRLIALLDGAG
jgi:uncharacterized protein YggU (UPF0235/DUF167 family)